MDLLDGLATFVAIALTMLVFGLIVRRVLGSRVGLLRAALAALVAATAGPPMLQALAPAPRVGDGAVTNGLYLALLTGFVLVLAMVLLVVMEVLVPDGSLPGPMEWWRNGRSRLSRWRRYVQILRVAARHGLARFLRGSVHLGVHTAAERRDLARALRRALEDGGVTFVKLGQQLSTRRDLLPSEFTTELARLQDDAPAVGWEEVRGLLETELGGPAEDAFASIDPEAFAAASVAQVHAARLRDGTDVVVKVQRPGIANEVDRDLDIMARLADLLADRAGWGASLGLAGLVEGFADALREELDFTIERDNLRSVATALRDARTRGLRVPEPHDELCTPRVLVMERMPGVPLGAAEEVLAPLGPDRRRAVADMLLEVLLDQLLESGIFHVDLHPGNLLVADDGTLSMLDLGSVGRLGLRTRQDIARLLAGLAAGDSVAASDALLDLVDRPEHVDAAALEQAVGVIILRYTTGGTSDGSAAFTSLFRLVSTHRLGVRPEVAAVFRAVGTLDGTLRAIDPAYDLVGRSSELGGDRRAARLEPRRLRESVEHEIATLLPVLRRLPRRVDRLADAAEHGRLSVGVRLLADPADRRFVTRLWHLGLLTILGATAGLMSAVLFAVGPGPMVTPEVGLYQVLATTFLAIATILVLRVLIVVLRRDVDVG